MNEQIINAGAEEVMNETVNEAVNEVAKEGWSKAEIAVAALAVVGAIAIVKGVGTRVYKMIKSRKDVKTVDTTATEVKDEKPEDKKEETK